jgi:hypothetical protein
MQTVVVNVCKILLDPNSEMHCILKEFGAMEMKNNILFYICVTLCKKSSKI